MFLSITIMVERCPGNERKIVENEKGKMSHRKFREFQKKREVIEKSEI